MRHNREHHEHHLRGVEWPGAVDVTWQPTGSPEPTGDMTGRSVEKEPPYPVPPAPPKRGTL